MSAHPPLLRRLVPADLPAVVRLQSRGYPLDYREPQAAFAAKLRASPDTAWGVDDADQPGELLAYLFALPTRAWQWPTLHADDWVAPSAPDGLYLHDLCLSPRARGQGLGPALVGAARSHAQAQGWQRLVLIAVQASGPFWVRQGFAPVPPDVLQSAGADASSFGDAACVMWAAVPPMT